MEGGGGLFEGRLKRIKTRLSFGRSYMKLKALSNSAFLIFDVMISCSQGGGGGAVAYSRGAWNVIKRDFLSVGVI